MSAERGEADLRRSRDCNRQKREKTTRWMALRPPCGSGCACI